MDISVKKPIRFLLIAFALLLLLVFNLQNNSMPGSLVSPQLPTELEETTGFAVEAFKANIPEDDSNLINFIRSKVLVPPAPSTSKLNLEKPIWKSPVLEYVMKVLGNMTHGFYVECGAYNGEWLSNSIELEEYFGWEGLLVEADPIHQPQLIEKRRKAWFAPACLSPERYTVSITMNRHKEWPAMSSIVKYSKHDLTDFPFTFEVQCYPLYSLLMALNRTVVDYLSLDVEGAEWKIIQTIPFDKLTIKVLTMEMNQDFDKITAYLQSIGYTMIKTLVAARGYVHDGIFAHKSIIN